MNEVQDDGGLPDFRALRRHPWVIVLWVVACLGGGYYYLKNATVRYRSAAQVLVMQQGANPASEQPVGVTGTVDEHVAKDLLGTHMQIIRSRNNLERALTEGGLESLPSLHAALEEDQSPIEYVLENLVVTYGGEGQAQTAQVLNLSFNHTSSEDSARILQAIIDVYQSFVREKFVDAGQQAAALVGKARDELAADLARKEEAYRRFREDTPLLLLGGNESLELHQSRLREIQTLISEHNVRYAQVKARAEIVQAATEGENSAGLSDLEKMASIGEADIGRLSFLVDIERGDPVTEASRNLEVARYDQVLALRLETAKQLLALRLEARKLETQFGADNPGLLATRDAIHELESFIEETPNLMTQTNVGEVRPAELLDAYSKLLRHDLEEMDRRYGELGDQAQHELRELDTQVAAGLTDESMRRDLERTRVAFDGVAKRLQDLSLVNNVLITEVISPVQPGEQVWPKLLIVIALSLFLGLLLGAACAVLVDVRDLRFRGAEDIQRTLQARVLTHIPNLHKRRNGAKGADPFLLALERPESGAAEAFRRLRTALCFGERAPGSNVIQVTSPTRGDGTTTLVTNLGVSLAQMGKRVLILDADLRNSRIHEVFGVDPEVGLTTYLNGAAGIQEVIKPTACENLFVIPAGSSPSVASELLSLPRLDELVSTVKTQFDFILVDSPPLMGVSDALVLAARADGVLLQIRTTKQGRTAAIQARSRLDQQGAAVLGIAVRVSGAGLV